MTAPASQPVETPPSANVVPVLGHIVPLRVLALTLGAVLVLTAITVGVTTVSWLDFGPAGNLWLALLIATAKATLVALYFMHLRYDKPVIPFILFITLCFAMMFMGLTLMDSRAYQHNIQQYREADPAHYAPELYNR